jgi:hypothetical protein
MLVDNLPMPVLPFKAVRLADQHGRIDRTVPAGRVPPLHHADKAHVAVYKGFRLENVNFAGCQMTERFVERLTGGFDAF